MGIYLGIEIMVDGFGFYLYLRVSYLKDDCKVLSLNGIWKLVDVIGG